MTICAASALAAKSVFAAESSDTKSVRFDLPLEHGSAGFSNTHELFKTPEAETFVRLEPGDVSLTLTFDLAALDINPNNYDEIQIEYKVRGSSILWIPELTAYPVKGLRRNWYSKIKSDPDQWVTARFDLRLDDDGWQTGNSVRDLNKRILYVTLVKQWLRNPDEPLWREVEIKNISFIRHPVKVDFDEFEGKFCYRKGKQTGIGYTYTLKVQNTTADTQKTDISVDVSRLKIFKADWTTKNIIIKPGSHVNIPLTLFASGKDITKCPPLYSECVQLFAETIGANVTHTPLIGYRPRLMWATVPPSKIPENIMRNLSDDERKKMNSEAESALQSDWGVPLHGPAGHVSEYYNQITAKKPVPLTWFMHKDPSTGEILTNDKIISAYISFIHSQNFERANLLADAFLTTGNRKYGAACRDIYLEYARFYPYMRAQGFSSTSARSRMTYASLHTALSFEDYIRAYSKIKNSDIVSAEDAELIEKSFLIPEIRVMYEHNVLYGNQQVHHFTGYTYGVLGLQKYWQLMGEALYGDFGFFEIVEKGFSQDGLAHEAGVYHWYMVMPMIHLAKVLERIGVNVMTPRFKRIFDGTVENSPDGIMTESRLAGELLYAYKIWRDPKYIPGLKAYGKWPPDFIDKDEVYKAEKLSGERITHSTCMSNDGYLWLREESSYGFRALSINYIQQRDRLEYDRLHYVLYDPQPLSAEIGRITYGDTRSKMMYATLGHNAVVVDEKNQLPLASELKEFLDRKSLPAALITHRSDSQIYAGIDFYKVIAIIDGIFFIGDVYTGKGGHTFDWPFYAPWQPWVKPGTAVPVFDTALTDCREQFSNDEITGYKFLKEIKSFSASESFKVRIVIAAGDLKNDPEKMLHLHFEPMKNAHIISATVPRGYRPEPGPMFFVRLSDRKTGRWGCAIDVTGIQAQSRVISVEDAGIRGANAGNIGDESASAWRVSSTIGTYIIAVNLTGTPVFVRGKAINGILEVYKE